MKVFIAALAIALAGAIGQYFCGLYTLGQLDAAVALVRRVTDAETEFARRHSAEGYTCDLGELRSELSKAVDKEPLKRLIESRQVDGYSLEIRGCQSSTQDSPNSSYQIVARSRHAEGNVCSDQSRVLRIYDAGCDQE
jgi:hypothetical protein